MWNDFWYRLRALFRGRSMECELDDELKMHLDRHVEKGLQAGLTRDEATRQAHLALGGMAFTKEECRQARGVSLLESTLQDLAYALRMLRKSPGFTAAVVLSLALGIGANTAIFSLIDAVMWKMLPIQDPERLLLFARSYSGSPSYGFEYRDLRRIRQHQEYFTGLAAYSPVRLQVSFEESLEPTAAGQLVTGAYFSTLGVSPVAGRAIGPEDDEVPDGHPVAMISHGFWKRRFGLDPSIIGRRISLSGRAFTIIGVTPPEFFGMEVGSSPDIYAPVMMQPTLMPAQENLLDNPIISAGWLRIVARLKPGIAAEHAAAAVTPALLQDAPRTNKDGSAFVPPKTLLVPAATGLSGLRSQFSQPLFVLLTIVGIVLLIACANTANLLLARAAARRGEFTMRRALGASRGRLIRQMLVESVLLATLGGVAGILLARWATRLLVAFMSAGRTPIVLELSPDLRILGFTAAVSLLTGILFGLVPAIRATRGAATSNVNGLSARTTGGRHGLRPGRILATVQLALSLVLLIGAGLFVRSVQKLSSQDSGFPRESVLIMRVEPKGSDQRNIRGTSERLDRIYKDLLQRVQSIPGVQSATLAHFSPTNRIGFSSPVKMPSGQQTNISRLMVYSGYFATMGIPIVAGRDFQAGDLRQDSAMVAVVNEAFARQMYRDESPVGRQFAQRDKLCEIIGVVKDSRYASLRGETPPVIYQPFFQTNTGRGQMTLHARVSGNSTLAAQRIREEVHAIDRDLPMFELRTLATELDAALVQERLIATLSSLFSVLALLLACVGLYGLLTFGVVQRIGEMGIRMALGARRSQVVRMILREALILVSLGVAISVPVALGLGRFAASKISGLLFGVTATDPTTIAAAAGLLTVVALVAGYLPARRASRVDPMSALRNE